MGWDVYAYRTVEAIQRSLVSYNPTPHLESEMKAVFEQADLELKLLTGISGGLADGEIGGSLNKQCLVLATPVSCAPTDETGVQIWSPETVREANALANWGFGVEELIDQGGFDKFWYEYTKCETQIFLQACAHNGYAILFSG